MLPSEIKPKVQPQWSVQRWSVAAALSLCGLAAWTLRKHASSVSATPWTSIEPLTVTESALPLDFEELAPGHESLEDVLKSLEDGASVAPQASAAGDFFSSVVGGVEVVEAHEASRPTKAAKGARPSKSSKPARTVVAPPAPVAGAHKAAGGPKKAAKPGRRGAEGAAGTAEANDALSKLEGASDTRKAKAIVSDFVQKMLASDSKTADEVVEKAMKKSRKKSAVKSAMSEPSEEDKREARAIIRDTLKKLESADGVAETPQASELRDKLTALLGGDVADNDEVGEKERQASVKDPEEDSHFDFVKLLKMESERKHEHTLASVKEEFSREFASGARPLLCSGCKLVAARLSSELSTHDVHEQDSPAQMLAAKRRAIDATCGSLRHLHVVSGEAGPRFEAGEAPADGPGQPGASQRLCAALLEDARFELLTKLIQRKVPETSHFHAPDSTGGNWERWLCAQRTRVCKRNEVQEDGDEEEL